MAVALPASTSTVAEARARRALDETQRVLAELASDVKGGRRLSAEDRVLSVRRLVEQGKLETYEPLLPLLFSLKGKPYTLHNHFVFSPQFYCHLPATSIWKTGRQVAKCCDVTDMQLVWMADGRPAYGHEIRAGDSVLSLGADLCWTPGRVLAVHATGEQTVYNVRTRLGSEFRVTAQHRFRTLYGYTPLADLSIGSRVAALRRGGQFGANAVPTDRIIITAYLIGDGSIGTGCGSNLNLTSACPEVCAEATQIGNRHQDILVRRGRKPDNAAWQLDFSLIGDIALWMREDDLWGKCAYEKHFPGWVWSLTADATRLFLSRLWATDGSIGAAANGTPSITYTSTSRRLAREVRCLLLKFGIPASIESKEAWCNGKRCRDAYRVRVETRDGWTTFQQLFSVPGKPPVPIPDTIENNNRDTIPIEISRTFADLATPMRRKKGGSLHSAGLRHTPKYPLTMPKLDRYIAHFEAGIGTKARGLEFLRQLRASDVIWDEITAIEEVGIRPTRDLEIESVHNFALDGVVTHNSTSISASGINLANAVPHKTLLYICPLYEQIRRLSSNYMRDLINQSPVRDLWTGTTTENSVLQRSFKNSSKMIFSFALLDADRIRGISSDMVLIDEIQDMDQDHLPIIRETMAVSDWKLQCFTGTPKTLDNTIEGLWRDSSMAEWFVPCWSCGKMNIPSLEFDLERMLGPLREDISPDNPATICAKCGRPINPRYGRWVHREPSRRWDFAGRHVPQVLLPLHYGNYRAWSELLGKQRGAANTAPHVFINEVLGESSSSGNQLLTLDDIRRAAVLPWANNPDEPDATMWDWLNDYPVRVLGVDWGGGGARRNTGMAKSGAKIELNSYTTLALLGMRSDGQIHVLWGKRLLTPHEHAREAKEVWHWCQQFRPRLVAHDYTGAGAVRETILVQAGMPVSLIMPIAYVRSASSSLIKYVQNTPAHQRDHYNLDKTRSLLYMCEAIKQGLIKTFRDDYQNRDNPGLLRDLIALVDEKVEAVHARDIYLIRKADGFTDDFAHSINLGCAALWHSNGSWPDFATLAGLPAALPLDDTQIKAAGNVTYGWDEDFSGGGFLSLP